MFMMIGFSTNKTPKNVLRITAIINAAGDTNVLDAINVGDLIQTETAGTITATAIDIGTGWDVGLALGSGGIQLDDGIGLTWGTDSDVTSAWDDAAQALEFTGGLVSIGNDAGGATATADNDLFVADALEVDGDTDLDGALDVDGATTLDQVTIDTTNGAFAVGGANTITLGDSLGTVSIDSSDWDISTTGDITGAGAITADGLATITIDDATANAITDVLIIGHSSTDPPAAGLGTGISILGEDAGGSEEQASIDMVITGIADGA